MHGIMKPVNYLVSLTALTSRLDGFFADSSIMISGCDLAMHICVHLYASLYLWLLQFVLTCVYS